MARKGRTFDQQGNVLRNNRPRRKGMGAAPQVPDDWSFGASVFELLNPGTVQREDAAIGRVPRTYTEVWEDAFTGVANAAEETRQEIVAEAKNMAFTIGPVIVIGLVAAAVLVVASKRR